MEQITFSELFERALYIARKWAWLIVLCSVIAAGTAYLVSRLIPPIYQASTTIMIDQAPDSQTSEYTAILTSERLARTYANMLVSRPVLEGVIVRLGLTIKVEDLQDAIQVEPVRDTQLLYLQVENKDPLLAASLTNTLVDVFREINQSMQQERFSTVKASLESELNALQEQIKSGTSQLSALQNNAANSAERSRLENELAQNRQDYNNLLQSYEEIRFTEARSLSDLIQVEKAVPPEQPVRPRVLLNTLLAAIVGIILSFGGVFVIEALDDTVKRPDQINRELGLAILGVIPRHDGYENGPISLSQPLSPAAESFRSLRTNIQFSSIDEPVRTLLIISSDPVAGKSTISANLSIVLAQGGKRVTLVDTDLRRPRIHKLFSLPNHTGLTSLFVRSEIAAASVLQPSEIAGLSILTSGELPPNPNELLSSRKMAEIVSELKSQSDLLVFDTAPVAIVSDAVLLSRLVDGVVLVIKPGLTSLGVIQHTLEQFKRAGARILGVVLNDVELKRNGYSPYYRDYTYAAYREAGEEKRSWIKRLLKRLKNRQSESDRIA